MTRRGFTEKAIALLLFCASVAWSALSVELNPRQPEQGTTFSFSLLLPTSELPAEYELPELQLPEGSLELLSSEAKEEERRDFFLGRYRVKRFHYQLKALQEGEHKVGLFWHYDGSRRSIDSTVISVQRSLDAAGLTISSTVNKRTVWEGEQLTLNIQLNAYRNFQQELGVGNLDFGSGFWGGLSDNSTDWKRHGGGAVIASRTLIAHLVPMRAGEQTIPPFAFKYLKEGRPERKVEEKQTAFGMSRFERITQEPKEDVAQSQPISIQVKPLPQTGKPAYFSGLVGDYSMSAKLSSDTTQLGSPVTLEVKVLGDGRPGASPQLQLPDLRDFRQVPPEEQITQTEKQGKKWTHWSGRWFLYPRRPGTFEIPSIRFSYFDPKAGEYRTAQSAPFTLRVGRGSSADLDEEGTHLSGPAPIAASPAQQKEIRALGSDIRYIITDGTNLKDQTAWPHRNPLFWLALLLLLALPAWAAAARALWKKTVSNPDRQRRSRARAAAQRQLREAIAARDAGQPHNFYNALERALYAAIAEALGAKPRGMTRHTLAEQLISAGFSGEGSHQLLALLARCDAARFAASGSSATEGELDQLLLQAEELLTQLWRVTR